MLCLLFFSQVASVSCGMIRNLERCVFFFFFSFPQSSVQLMVPGILSDLVLSVDFSFTCSDFLDYFLHV